MVKTLRKKRKTRLGLVVSNRMNKTCVVKVVRVAQHKFYKKVIKKSRKFYVHDEKNAAGVGDLVLISETRPLSRLKRWRLVKILKKGGKQFKAPESEVLEENLG
jgi:small subunit ribosomal protein S17